MSEFVEVAFWLFIFIALALRNVANKAKRASQAQTLSQGGPDSAERARLEAERAVADRAAPRREAALLREAADPHRGRGPARANRPSRPEAEKRGSILGSFAELAREIEREMRDAADAGREGQEPDRTVVVPGRRVVPGESTALYETRGAVPVAPDKPPAAPRVPPARAPSEPAPKPRRRRGGSAGAGLRRLERYGPLKRAVILSEILGTPPGLSEGERRLGRWDPS